MNDRTSEVSTREGRRRDVLAASREVLDEHGWDGFSIRAIAAGAGVSTGAVYQWFSGKNEIYSELYAEEIRKGIDQLHALPNDIGFEKAVRVMVDWAVELFERMGHYELEFFEGDAKGSDDIPELLIEAYLEIEGVAADLLRKAANAEGRTLVDPTHGITWLWASAVGVAERLLVSPAQYPPPKREAFLVFTAEAIARGLVADT